MVEIRHISKKEKFEAAGDLLARGLTGRVQRCT